MTCKYVERSALNTQPVLNMVRKHNIVTLRADWTKPNAAVEQAMQRYDSVSIPLLVIIPAEAPEDPIILRDVYSRATLLEKLEEAVARNRNRSLAKGNGKTPQASLN